MTLRFRGLFRVVVTEDDYVTSPYSVFYVSSPSCLLFVYQNRYLRASGNKITTSSSCIKSLSQLILSGLNLTHRLYFSVQNLTQSFSLILIGWRLNSRFSSSYLLFSVPYFLGPCKLVRSGSL